ncbi:Cyclic nucleotide-binding protein [Pseudocohnilembus persalinus]|uniref:Cyclic nucleotide-binding protein n=1 Tax=Pseudocohnilembus persalinus TaxID=266149 RepID=A0A0V0R523_PSEPJ|nr:Cyclic nucleotide-binding protein [Pseudocohnilembus persalinus]|eukprot:KRX09456.1 Cyclic nucleotide-binding protein [Pseudocohnilembus persalinus]
MSIERHYYIYGERSYSYTIISLFIKLIGFCHAVGTKGNNQIEITFTVIIMFLTVGIFGYLIGSINIILEELNKKSKNYKQELEVVNKYLRNKEVSQELQSRVRNYLEYLHRASGDMTASGEVSTVLDKLPKNLSQDIQIEVKSEYLMYFPFIYNHFSDRVLEQLIYEIEERYYVPNEIIFKQGDFEDICIFLVAKGQERETISQAQQTNSIYNNQFNYKEGEKQDFGKNILSYNQNQNRGINMQDIQEKEVFGENCFCSGLAYPYTARSSKFSTLYCIKRSSFLKIIERYPFDYEKFCLIKDQIFLNGISKYAKKHCFICKKEHTEKNCNVIHYQPDKLTLIEKYEYSTPQTDRIFKIRPYRKRVRCLEIIEDLYVIKRDIKLDENLRLKIKEIEKIQNDYNQQIYDEYDLEAEQDNYYYDDYNSEESSENEQIQTQNFYFCRFEKMFIILNDQQFNLFFQIKLNSKIEEQDSQFLSYQSESNNNNIFLSNDHQSRKSMNTSQGYRRQSLQSQQTFRSKRPSERLASETSENNQQNNSSEVNNTSFLQYNTKASNVLQIQLTKHSNNSRLLENNSITKMSKLHHKDKNQEDFRNRHENKRSKFNSKNMKDQFEDRQQNYSQQNVKFGDNFNVNRDVIKRIPTYVQTDGQGSNIKYDYGISKSMKSMKSMKSYKSLFSVKSKVRFDQQQNVGNHELQKLKTNMNQKDLNDILFKLFDKQKEYKIYNPQNNLNRVLSKYKGYMRWNLKKQRNKNYKLFTQKYTTFKSLETQVNIRKTVINPNTKKVMKTIIYKKALKLNENQNLQAAHDKFENLQI